MAVFISMFTEREYANLGDSLFLFHVPLKQWNKAERSRLERYGLERYGF
jgi:hypothetical protein